MTDCRLSARGQGTAFLATMLAVVVSVTLIGLAPAALAGSQSVRDTQFDRVELGYQVDGQAPLDGPYSSWYPTDIDGDGTWELAILTAGEPRRCGLFDPATSTWVAEPVVIPAAPYRWGLGDWDGDGFLEYVYVLGDSVCHFDSRTSDQQVLWRITGVPWVGVTALWGYPSGAPPQIGILLGLQDDLCSEGWRSYWAWEVHDLFSGYAQVSLPGGEGGRHVPAGCGADHPSLALFKPVIEVCDDGLIHWTRWTQEIDLVDQYWHAFATAGLPSGYEGGSATFLYMRRPLYADCTDRTPTGEPILVYYSVPEYPVPSVDQFLGAIRISDSQPLWMAASPWEAEPTYSGLTLFDWDEDGVGEVILPLSTGAGWELRDLLTGVVLDTVHDMPAVDLRTGPLFELGMRELFYLEDSGLYVWNPDVVVAVEDDESAQRLPTRMILTATPNPFNAAVLLTWSAADSPQALEIYNVLGQRVRDYDLAGGGLSGTLSWDGRDQTGRSLASGVYLARLVGASEATIVKLVLLK